MATMKVRRSPKGMAAMEARLTSGILELIDEIFSAHVFPSMILSPISEICEPNRRAP